MEKQNQKSILPLCIILAFIIIAGILGVNVYKSMNKNSSKENVKENVGEKVTYKNNFNLDDIIPLVKDYYNSKNLVNLNNLESWNITKATYIGAAKDKNIGYYHLEGTYSCKDQTHSCVYVSQEVTKNGKNIFDVYVEVEEKSGEKTILNISQLVPDNDLFSKDEEELSSDLNKYNDIINLLKKYYETNNLVNSDNLKSWNFTSVEYYYKKANSLIYEIQSTYICKDNTSDCVYVSQVDNPNNDNSYNIKLYVEVDENKSKIISIDTLPYKETPKEDKKVTKESIISPVKKYFEDNSLVNKDNLTSWNITKVTYVGFFTEQPNKKIYKLEGSYKCNDSSSECLYLEQVGNKNPDNSYPFQIYATFIDNNNTLTFENVFGTLTSQDNFNEVNELIA